MKLMIINQNEIFGFDKLFEIQITDETNVYIH